MNMHMKTGILALLLLLLLIPASLAAQVGPEAVLPASPSPAHRPHVSYGNGQYLVVWQSGMAENADIYGCRLTAEGKPIDRQPFVICKAVENQEYPRASWGPSAGSGQGNGSWLVVWSDLRNGKDYDVYAARVSAGGKVLDPDGICIAGGEHNQCKPDVAWSDGSWLTAWRAYEMTPDAMGKTPRYSAYGARLSADGKVRDSKPIEVARILKKASSVSEPRVVSTGSGWLVAWVGNRLIDSGPPGWFHRGVSTTLVTSSGQAATRVATYQPPRKPALPPVTAVSNGKDGCLAVWENHGTGGRSGPDQVANALRMDTQGKNLGLIYLGPEEKRNQIWQPSAAWDGKGYVVACWDGWKRKHRPAAVSRIVAHLVAEDGKYEGVVEVSNGKPHPAYFPAAAGDGKGKALVVYERHPAKAGDTILIAARLVRR